MMMRIKIRHWIGIMSKTIFALGLLLLIVLGFLFYKKYGKRILLMEEEARKVVAASTYDTFKQTETGMVFDANGSVITRLKGAKDVYYIPYEDIPKEAVEAIVSIEDKKFFKHKGYDLFAIFRAGLAYIKNKGVITQGGSTITQQLARNIFLSFEESWERKVREIFISIALEKKYTKKDLMEFYLNNIYFANGYYGIQAASYGYFGKGVQSLSLSQIAFLLSIPNSPNRYDPYQNIEGTLGRRDRILGQMKEDGKIDEAVYQKAVAETIKVKDRKKKKSSYVETFALDRAVKALMKENGFRFRYTFSNQKQEERYEEEYAKEYAAYQSALYAGGYRIYTSIDPKKQELLQGYVDKHLEINGEKSKEGVYKLQGSAVSIDNETGRVVAIVGGRSQNFAGSTLNRAYQSHRQPGSTIKPLVVYAPAFEQGYTPESIVKDERIEKGPVNADGIYSGNISVIDAVARSKNTTAWRLFTEISPAKGIGKLLSMKFTGIKEGDYYPAAALGGMTKGVSALELSSAYAAIENDGLFREPTCIVKITDSDGKDIVPDRFYEAEEGERVYTEEAANMMITCMEAVMKRGTGRGGALLGIPCAGKTGTTNNANDLWFAGFTKQYTTAVWVGFDIPESLNSLPFSASPLSIWKEYMQEIHKGLAVKELNGYVLSPIDRKKEEELGKDEVEVPEEAEKAEDETEAPEVPEPTEEEREPDEAEEGYGEDEFPRLEEEIGTEEERVEETGEEENPEEGLPQEEEIETVGEEEEVPPEGGEEAEVSP